MNNNRFEQLRLQGVSRRFGGHEALADLELTIRAGEFIALLGPSGCGKSTALNCIAGLLPLTGGSIWQDGHRIDTVPPERRGFGMVFQSYALFPHMSVRGNVAFGLRMRGLSKKEVSERTARVIQLVQLQAHADKLPGQLSGGQQQRVAIARAVVLEPSLVLMDEPLSNLDAKLRLEMRTEIRRLHQSLGLTTIYVTHDQEEALSLADRLVVLRDGRVQQVGTPEELHRQPLTWHVADFMGYRNLLPVQAGRHRDRLVEVPFASGTMLGTAVGGVQPGDGVVAAVRPEDVQLGEGAGGMAAEVEVVEYQGREFAVEVRTRDGQRLHLRTDRRLAPGDQVSIRVDPARLLVFPADGFSGGGAWPEESGDEAAAATDSGEQRAELAV
jgi:putative spermidine/putrescine transport system ATP-binding protein